MAAAGQHGAKVGTVLTTGAARKGPGASLSFRRLEGFGSVTVASGLRASQSPQGAKVTEHPRCKVGGCWGLPVRGGGSVPRMCE